MKKPWSVIDRYHSCHPWRQHMRWRWPSRHLCLFFCVHACDESESEVAQSCPTHCDPMDCSLPGSSVHGIFQARVLEWVSISFFKGSFRPRDWNWISHIVGRCFTVWVTRENTSLFKLEGVKCSWIKKKTNLGRVGVSQRSTSAYTLEEFFPKVNKTTSLRTWELSAF